MHFLDFNHSAISSVDGDHGKFVNYIVSPFRGERLGSKSKSRVLGLGLDRSSFLRDDIGRIAVPYLPAGHGFRLKFSIIRDLVQGKLTECKMGGHINSPQVVYPRTRRRINSP